MKKITLLFALYIACLCPGYGLAIRNSSCVLLQEVTCPQPTAIMISSFNTSSATFVWTAGETENSWQVLVLPASDPAPSSATSGTEVTEDPTYTANNLTGNTAYRFYVRANCGSEFSDWTPFEFTSGCNPVATFNENFDSTGLLQLPDCWYPLLVGASEYAYAAVTDFYAQSGANSIEINNYDSGPGATVMLVSPGLSTLSAGTHRLRFFARHGTEAVALEVGTIDSATFEGVFNLVQSVSLTGNYAEYVVDFTTYTGTDTFLAFRHPNNVPYMTIHIDDIRWEPAPQCPNVSALQPVAVTATSATISWQPGDWEEQWDVVYGPASVTDPDLLVPITPAPEGNPEATLTGLTENTAYNVWVRADCNLDGMGAWIGPLSFTTPCVPSNTLYENFDSTNPGSLPSCWMGIVAGDDAFDCYVQVVGNNSVSGNNSVEIFNMFAGDASKLILVTPHLGSSLADATHRIKFQARVNSIFPPNIEVGTLDGTSGSANFTTYQTIVATDTFTEYTIDFSGYTGTDTYIGIRSVAGMFSSVYLDDITWEALPLCGDVSAIAVAAVTTDSASFTWTPAESETQWDVVYGPASVTDPNTLTPVSPAPSGPSITIAGLDDATFYNLWVRALCGGTDGNGSWIGPLAFSTACFATSLLDENFDSSNVGYLPVCWTGIVSGPTIAPNATVEIVAQNAYSGVHSVILSNEESLPADDIMLVSPPLNTIATGTHRLKFYAFRYAFAADAILTVGTMNGNTSAATFTPFQQVAINGAYAEYTVNFLEYSGTDTHIAIRNSSPNTHTAIFLDDIRWELAPLCPDVVDIQLSGITPNSATVNWTSGGPGNGWQVAYANSTVTDPSTLTPSEILSEPTYLITSLTDNTSYNIWVRSVCNATGNGEWIGPIALLTTCLPVGVPYILDFENAVTPNLPECTSSVILNNSSIWRTQMVTQNGFDSKVLRYIRSVSNAADAWFFTQGVEMTVGTNYIVSYSYGGTNTNVVDKMKVMLGTSADVAAMTEEIGDHTFSLNDAVEAVTTFTPPATGIYYMGFHLYSNAGQGIVHVDNISIDAILANPEVSAPGLSYHPNPVRDILNLQHTDVISHITVFNMLGQLVLESSPQQRTTALDMSGLSGGSYLVKVISGNTIKTIKVFKQ